MRSGKCTLDNRGGRESKQAQLQRVRASCSEEREEGRKSPGLPADLRISTRKSLGERPPPAAPESAPAPQPNVPSLAEAPGAATAAGESASTAAQPTTIQPASGQVGVPGQQEAALLRSCRRHSTD